MSETKIKSNSKVKVHYELFDGDDNLIQSTYQTNQPFEFNMGNREIITGFEESVLEKSVGDKFEIEVPTEKGYGERSEENIKEFPLDDNLKNVFKQQLNGMPEVGHKLSMSTNDGQIYEFVVNDIDEEKLVADFNHQLAGQEIKFKVEILEVS